MLFFPTRISRLFRRINKALFDFKPNALEPGIQRHGNVFIFDLDRFEPSRVTRYRLSIAYLADPQTIRVSNRNAGLSSLAPPTSIGSDLAG